MTAVLSSVKTSRSLFALLITALFLIGVGSAISIENPLSLTDCWKFLVTPHLAESFDEYYYAYGTLPRLVAALAGGAILGLAGSVLQQLTQNPLTSPLTLGTSSGAWLAIVAATAFFPDIAANGLSVAAFSGALAAFGLIVLITGLRHLTGVSLIISGMVVNLLFGSLATALILLKSEFIQNVFLWGAGDLAQNGWTQMAWLAPRIAIPALLLLIFAPRALALLSLGESGAKSRGLPVAPVFMGVAFLAVWIVSAFITAAGVINFTGLIAPNIARAAGWKTPRAQLVASVFIGAALLTATDALAVWLSALTGNIVPSGVVSAAAGTPIFIALILCQRGKQFNQDSAGSFANILRAPRHLSRPALSILGIALAACLTAALFVAQTPHGVQLQLPTSYSLTLHLPRLVTALFAGAGLAVAGVILQRLIQNPLASPDILGVSSGASAAMVLSSLFLGTGVGLVGSAWALVGSVFVLAAILLFARGSHYSPAIVILIGIAVSAFLDSLTSLALARGTMENYYILQWLSGSTYRTSPRAAGLLALAVAVLLFFTFAGSRAMALLTVGREFAQSRGLPLSGATLVLLVICALLCSVCTAAMGPVAFVGLVAPHMALLSGARRVKTQITTASLMGAALVGSADWLGQTIMSPAQIPAGTLASILGATYFLSLLLLSRLRS